MSMFIPQSLAGGRYTVGELVGHGGMAQVHIGTDTRLGRTVAIKIMRSDLAEDSIFLTRFRREARAVAQLNNPNIVSIYDSGEEQLEDASGQKVRVPYIVMEYIKGQTLRDIIKVNGSLSPRDAEQVMVGVLNALDYSHRMGIIHRDIKPGNIMISDQGTVKVMDFGIARALDDSSATMTQNQGVVGTAQYLSPEQARGEQVGTKSDVYSAGCVLYEMLTGKPPFTGDSAVAIAYQHVSETATPPSTLIPGLDKQWDAIVAKAMAKDTANRYSDAASFRQDIVTIAHGGVPAAVGASNLTNLSESSAQTSIGATQPMQAADDDMEETKSWTEGSLPEAFDPQTAALSDQNDSVEGPQSRTALRRQEQKKKHQRTLIISGVVAIVAIAAVMFGLWYFFTSQNKLVSVPTIDSSMSVTQAKEAITGAGLTFQQESDTSSSEPKGTFTKQSPAGGKRVARGTTVKVWFSAGPQAKTIPTVKGMTQQRAIAVLSAAGFKVSSIATENSNTVAKDHVTRTDPAAGTQQAAGTSVVLYISTGKTTVPTGLVGLTQASAQKELNSRGFSTNAITQESSTVPAGKVISVSPAEGTTVDQGATITLYVSSGPKMISTPSQSTMSNYADSGTSMQMYLKSLGFTNVTISGSASDPVDTVTFNGKDISEVSSPQLAANTKIVITTSAAPDPDSNSSNGSGSNSSPSSSPSSSSGDGGDGN